MQNEATNFPEIHDTFRPRVLRYLKRLVGERDAEDLTQLVMVKVSDGLAHFRGDSELSTWIYRIATNIALDRFRSSAFRAEAQSIPAGELESAGFDNLEELKLVAEQRTSSTEATAIRGEMSACIREFVDRLPDPYRIVIVLKDMEGFKNREVAEILGQSLDTVKIRLHRARENLKQDLVAGCTFHRDDRHEFACDRRPSTPPSTS
ncbi:MAG: RNA polymerase sigma factor [Burkholderiales bacterium]